MLVSKRIQKLAILVFVVFAVRVLFSFLPSFQIDMNAWLAWANRLVELGPAGFYSNSVWTQYTPGYLYWLWLGGSLGWINTWLVKLPVILADIVVGLIILKIAARKSEKLGLFLFLIYTLNPVTVFTGSIWGQIDGIFTLPLILSAYFLVERKRLALSGFFWAIAFLIKPQALVFLPPIFLFAVFNKGKIERYLLFALSALATLFLASIPFFPNDPVTGLVNLVSNMTAYYNYTSVFAFNFWAIVGMWKVDSQAFLGISYYVWGFVLYLLSLFAIVLTFRKSLTDKKVVYLIFALSAMGAFLFPTRVHERYLFPMFALLLIAAGKMKSRILLILFGVLSILNFLNLYHPYAYYSENYLRNEGLLRLTGDLAPSIGVLSIIIFIALLAFEKLKKYEVRLSLATVVQLIKSPAQQEVPELFTTVRISKKSLKYLLLIVLAFSFLTRLYSISSPSKEYFDEVYHAFTARLILHNDPKAWEWWNPHPEGFAYEWTHPPVGKYFMALGMVIFGENSFGWRFPGVIFGTISVYLLYLIVKQLFKDELLAIISASVLALDGIFLVLSRIAMADVYLLTFILASFYFFLKGKNLLSSVFLGIALATKWSALWLIPIIFVSHFLLSKKLKWSYAFFVFIPPLVYLLAYWPFFTTDHTFKQFFNFNTITKCYGQEDCDESYGLQQQMWSYHTKLSATHSYTSPWWSWPLNARPVYLYTSDEENGFVSRIYLIGNPIISWFGVLGILGSLVYIYKTRSRLLAIVVFSYLVFFVPWALSPRIMFLYHYLPSIPFMAIAIGYFLRRYLFVIPYFFFIAVVFFVYFYAHWAGIWVPESLDASYYWFSSWR